jgi:MoaA/NifB/PqqE/SkfB family radical SAM enzyme
MNPNQESKREKLRKSKPLVYEKVMKFDEKLKRGETIGIIQLQYDYRCNLKCKHCSIAYFQKLPKRLTIEKVKDIFEQADKLGLARVTITGGEPLMFQDLKELVQAINPQKFYINMDSNGFAMTREKAISLKNIGIDRIQLSLDSLNYDQHDSFRGKSGSWAKVMEAIKYVRNAGLDIFMQTCVTKSRLHSAEFLGYLYYFHERHVPVFVTFAKPVGAYSGQFDEMIDDEDLRYMRKLETIFDVFTHLTPAYGVDCGCPAGINIFSITAQGDVLPCPYFHCTIGNLFDECLETILQRMQNLNVFRKNTCLLAADKEFVDKYLVKKIYNKKVPVDWKDVFNIEDFNHESN